MTELHMSRTNGFAPLLFLLALWLAPATHANVTLSELVSGLSTPVDIAHAGDGSGRLFVVEQNTARIRVIENGTLLATPFLDLGSVVESGGERGLLGLAFHPQYPTNGQFFVYYTSKAIDGLALGDVVIARFQCCTSPNQPNVANPASRQTILTIGHSTYGNHNGGALRFGPDGYLYAGIGDGGSGGDPFNAGQNLNTLLAKILRIDINAATYTIPPTNPFASGTGPGGVPARGEIWAWGVRNPWRISFDRVTGDLYIGDVGQGAWEEINRQDAGSPGGANYGWRILEATHCYNPSNGCVPPLNYVPPLLEYDHGQGVSVTGGYVYRGLSTPDLAGKYVFGDFSYSKLWFAPGDAGAPFTQLTPTAQVSTFGEGETGELYLANYANGRIYSFSSSTDNTPDPIRFAPRAGVALNALQTSNTVRITGLGVNAAIAVSGGEYSINCGASFTSVAATIANGNTVCVRHTSAATGNAISTTTLTIGTSSFSFTSTTRPAFAVTPSASAGGSISPATVQIVEPGATATFNITPLGGFAATVGGTCGGSLAGNVFTTSIVVADCTVVATFTFVAPVPPAAPAISQIIAGDGLVAIYFTPPSGDGGAPVTHYLASCAPGGATGTASASPVIVSGLNNGSGVTCTVAAVNAAGTGAPSVGVAATPSAGEPLTLLNIVSRKSHGSAGVFDLPIDPVAGIGGAVTIEPRLPASAHTLAFRFNRPITAAGTAAAVDSSLAAVPAHAAPAGTDVMVTLSGIIDNRRVTVTLEGVNGVLSQSVSLGFLTGEVSRTRQVTAADLSSLKSRFGQTVTQANFQLDLDVSGSIGATDLSAMKSRAGQALP